MRENEVGQRRKSFFRRESDCVHVFYKRSCRITLAEIATMSVDKGKTVSEMVGPADYISVFTEVLCHFVVAHDIFLHTVDYLKNTYGIFVGVPYDGVQRHFAPGVRDICFFDAHFDSPFHCLIRSATDTESVTSAMASSTLSIRWYRVQSISPTGHLSCSCVQ